MARCFVARDEKAMAMAMRSGSAKGWKEGRRGVRNFRRRKARSRDVACAGKRRSFGEQIADYVEGGPKLRKWYGASDEPRRWKEETAGKGGEEGEQRDGSVLVVGGDTPVGELVVLQLVLASARVTALVKDAQAEKNAYGPYVVPVGGTSGDPGTVEEALRGARSVVVIGQLGCVAELAVQAGQVEHMVLLSSVGVANGGSTGFARLMGGEKATINSIKREQKVVATGIPYTIVRVVELKDAPMGRPTGIRIGDPGTMSGNVTRADAATVLVKALEHPPRKGRLFEVAAGDMGSDGQWEELFASIQEV